METMVPARRRDAVATRAAILASARRAFAASGYDGAGVREIASGAGVTAMLVNRYFGSKEQLFAEVVADTMADPVILAPENLASPTIAHDLAAALVGLTEAGAGPLDGFLVLFRSASSPVAARIAREQIGRIHHATAIGTIRGDLAPERAAILLSLVAGVQMMRQMIGLSALAEASPDALVWILEPLFREILGIPPALHDLPEP
jgi:AcrR family transcriptional regulator